MECDIFTFISIVGVLYFSACCIKPFVKYLYNGVCLNVWYFNNYDGKITSYMINAYNIAYKTNENSTFIIKICFSNIFEMKF